MSTLYTYTNYTNEFVDHLSNVQIIEYDMKDAGLSLSKKYGLLPESTIRYLSSLTKDERKVKMGKMQLEDKQFRKNLSTAFIEGRKLFFEENDLAEENILSIKKDAIFTLKQCQHTDFGELVFAEKNHYSSYYKFDRYEYYYYNEGLDVKGIADEKLLLHRDSMLSALHEFMFLMESANTPKVIRYIKEFVHYYRERSLPMEFYRELNRDSLFRLNIEQSGSHFATESIDASAADQLLINYNYNTYLMPLIDIVLRRG